MKSESLTPEVKPFRVTSETSAFGPVLETPGRDYQPASWPQERFADKRAAILAEMRLMAAAPVMLEAVKYAAYCANNARCASDPASQRAFGKLLAEHLVALGEMARAAIALAEGESR